MRYHYGFEASDKSFIQWLYAFLKESARHYFNANSRNLSSAELWRGKIVLSRN